MSRFLLVLLLACQAKSAGDLRALGPSGTLDKSPPPPPTDVEAIGGNGEVTVTWSLNAASSYVVVERTPQETEVGAVTGNDLVHTGLLPGTTHTYVVHGVNVFGQGDPSDEVTALTLPAAPASLTATASAGRIDLAWAAAQGGVAYVVFRRDPGGGSYSEVATVGGLTYADIGLTAATSYTYFVRAKNQTGQGDRSPFASAQVP
ncbi:MAG: fibronectin type III domain-containing protein [Deltaproteobacteria bacterium]|nr:fibronectin type III domain-containing protein [Deltaproteobacteria bacterium]